MKIAEFANSVDPDEVAHYEPSHQDLYGLPSSLSSRYDIAWMKLLLKICRRKFCHLLFGA